MENFKNDAKVMIDFQINVTKIENGQTVTSNHMDGKFTVEVNQLRQIIRSSVASAVKGVADGLEDEIDFTNDDM